MAIVFTGEQIAQLFRALPQDIAADAAKVAKALGGSAAESVDIFQVASPETVTLVEEMLATASVAVPGRWWVWAIKIAGLIGLESILEKVLAKGASGGLALVVGHWPNMAAQIVGDIYNGLDTYTPIGAQVMGLVYDRVFPGGISQQGVADAMATKPGDAQDPQADSDTFGLLGSAFNDIFDQMFDLNAVAQDFKGRTQSFGSHKNFRRVMGANLSVGIRAQTMAIVSQLFPLGPLQHLTHLHQHLIVSLGLNRLAHTMLAVNVQNLIHRGVQQDLNRNLKWSDLTQQRAIQANISGLLDTPTLHQIMDNEGLRDDVRDIEVALQEKDLSDAQLETLWQEQQIDEAYLTKAFRLKSFGQERAGRAVDLIKNKRFLHLRDEYVTRQRRLFVDCVIDELELRQTLADAHYTQQEADQVVKNDLVARRFRQFMGTGDMFKSVKLGLRDLGDALNQLQCRGWTWDEAVEEAILRLQDHLPDCQDAKLKDKALIALLQALGTGVGISGKILNANVLKYLQCLSPELLLVKPEVTFTVEPTSVVGSGYVTLKWTTLFATAVHITPGPGPVPLSGDLQEQVKKPQGYTLTASNLIGKTVATVFVNVTQPPPLS